MSNLTEKAFKSDSLFVQFIVEKVTLNDLLHHMTRQDLADMHLR